MTSNDPIQGILRESPRRLFFISRSDNRAPRRARTSDPIQGVFFSTNSPEHQRHTVKSFKDLIYEGVRRSYVTSLDDLTLSELGEILKSNSSFTKYTHQNKEDFITMCTYMHRRSSTIHS